MRASAVPSQHLIVIGLENARTSCSDTTDILTTNERQSVSHFSGGSGENLTSVQRKFVLFL